MLTLAGSRALQDAIAIARHGMSAAAAGMGALEATHRGATALPPANAELIGAGIGRLSNMVVESGEGSWVWTADGERYLDFACGIGVTNLGHRHPEVLKAVHEQVDKIWHAQINIAHHSQMLILVDKLRGVMPAGSGLDSFLLVTTGAEAVEAAVKLARHATGKPNLIVFQGGYHGRTALTGAMTTSKYIFRARYGPAPAGIFVAPFPYANYGGLSVEACLGQLELMLQQQTTAEETAAVVIEPVLGEGGYLPCPPEFLQGIRDFCDRHGILLIADEVQTGFGRTGKMFAIEHAPGVQPDVLIFAKGVASGLPLAGIASRRELTDRQPAGSQGGTYAGNAISCSAANATIDVLKRDGFMQKVNERGEQLRSGLEAMRGILPIKDIRGHGLMIGVEFDKDKLSKGIAAQVSKACLSRGLIMLQTGVFETIRMVPPLNVSASDCEHALRIIRASLEEVASCQ